MNRGRLTTGVIGGIVMLLALIASAASPVSESTHRKARYYYGEGARMQALDSAAAAMEYYRKAYELDPDYAEAASGYGRLRLGVLNETLQTRPARLESLRMLQSYVDRFPDDVYESQYYGYVAGRLDTVDEAVRVFERTAALHPDNSATLYHLADALAANGRYKEAAAALDRYEAVEGESSDLSLAKMSYYFADNDTLSAENEIHRLVARNPKDATTIMLKGNFFEMINRPDSALACFLLAEKLDPEAPAPKMALSEVYRQKGDSVAYDNEMYDLLLSEDFSLDNKVMILSRYLQRLLMDKNDTRRGDNLFSVLRKQYPHEAEILDLSARYNAAKGNPKAAEEEISYAIDQKPANTTYWGQLMTYQMADERPEDAVATYNRARQHVDPDYSMQLFFATAVAPAAKRYDLSVGIFREMLRQTDPGAVSDTVISLSSLNPKITLENLDRLSTLYTGLGDIYHEMEKNDSAFICYENAITVYPDDCLAKNNYAYYISNTPGADLERALKLITEVCNSSCGSNPTYIDTYAWVLYKLGRYEEAAVQQKKALDTYRDSALDEADEAVAATASENVYAQAAKTEEQKNSDTETARKAALSDPSYLAGLPELYLHYGDILMRLNRREEAAGEYRKGIAAIDELEAQNRKFVDEKLRETRNELSDKLKEASK